jgi:hypothetical protein
MLLKVAAEKNIDHNYIFNELYLRGLILNDGKVFCPYFAEVIKEEFEKLTKGKKSLESALSDIEKGLGDGVNWVNTIWDTCIKGAKLVGEVRGYLQPNENND